MSKELEGKIALITGDSRGMGAAIAKRLAANGANVAITYTKGSDAAASVVKEIERAGRKAIDRYGRVDKVAALVAFVAGPESSYITGAKLGKVILQDREG
jgi:3-oxoacyl-[acyl-carrier protein] reductase